METFNTNVKREAIEMALREAVRAVKRQKALQHRGTLNLDIDRPGLEELRESE